MGVKGYTCSIRALYAFNGTHVVGKSLAVDQMVRLLGPNAILVKRSHEVSHRAIFGNADDRVKGYMVYLRNKDFPPPSPIPQPAQWFDRRLLLVLWDDTIYPKGHCLVVWPPRPELPGLWSLRDPWRVDGTAVSLKRRQLELLLAGADNIIYFADGDIPENLRPRTSDAT
jgi:hypothetical protein